MNAKTFYQVPVSTLANVTAHITVVAESAEQANQKALDHVVRRGAPAELDEDSIHWKEAYLPDPDEGAERVAETATDITTEINPRGVVVVSAKSEEDDFQDPFHCGVFVNGELAWSGTSADTRDKDGGLTQLAENLARILGGECQYVMLKQMDPRWDWADVARQLATFGEAD